MLSYTRYTIVEPPDKSIFPSFPATSSSCAACFSKADPFGTGFRFGGGVPSGLCTVPGSDILRGEGMSAVSDLRDAAVDEEEAAGVDPRRSPSTVASGAEPWRRRGSEEEASPSVDADGGWGVERPGMAEARLKSPPPDDDMAEQVERAADQWHGCLCEDGDSQRSIVSAARGPSCAITTA